MNFKSIFLAGLLLLSGANSLAVSLGRHSGATLIGRPLNISVQAVLNAQEDIGSLCIDADVFYGDNRLDKSRVRISTERPLAGSPDAVIRIRSAVPVDEPVVSLYVRVGCQQKVERRYVTLADVVSEVANEAALPKGAANFPAPQVQPLLPPVTLPALQSPGLRAPESKSSGNARSSKDSQKLAKAASKNSASLSEITDPGNPPSGKKTGGANQLPAAAAQQARTPNRSLLKLEPLDLSIDREPQLKASSQLLSAPSASPQERTAAAALWRAIASQPQDIVRDFEKLQGLESSVLALQTQTRKTQQSISELDDKLKKAEADRYANVLVYALVTGLLLAVAGLAYVLRSRSVSGLSTGSDSPWWRRREKAKNPRSSWSDSGAHADDAGPEHEGAAGLHKQNTSSNTRLISPEIDLDDFHGSSITRKAASSYRPDSLPPVPSVYQSDFGLSMNHASRAVKVDELFDVHQQADFFVSIGQSEQAIEVLRNHLGGEVQTSVLVYLDLFNLYHQLARKGDYAALRDDFNGRFNTKVPVFEMYTVAGPGLEAYQLAMSRIEALWPSPKVLDIIEDSIFKRPETVAEAFNLEAYRDLLMLYSVAKDIISPENKTAVRSDKSDGTSLRNGFKKLPGVSVSQTDLQPRKFVSTSLQPLSANVESSSSDAHNASSQNQPASTIPPASPNVGLDLDLSEPDLATPPAKLAAMAALQNSRFTAESDKNADATLPLDIAPQPVEKVSDNTGNMIAFDDLEIALTDANKPKAPKTGT